MKSTEQGIKAVQHATQAILASFGGDRDGSEYSDPLPLPAINELLADSAFAMPEKVNEGKVSRNPINTITYLEQMPHLRDKVEVLWKSRDLNTFIAKLFLDSRNGERAGLPIEVAKELMFLSQLNLQLRAEEAAQLHGISFDEATEIVGHGDQLALGHPNGADDVWTRHGTKTSVDSMSFEKPVSQINSLVPPVASPKLSAYIRDIPPIPATVRLDISTPKALRSARAGHTEGGIMEKGLFRCLAKELSNLKIGRLVLSSLGDSSQCSWLASGIRFIRMHCNFRKVVLQVDLLSTPEPQLRQCIHEGTGHLVIYLNLTSGKWRAKAQKMAATDPDYFRREIRRLLAFRDEYAARSGHQCEISVVATSRHGNHALNGLFDKLSETPGLVKYQEVALPPGVSILDAKARGSCHCLAPFIEAHVRSNGHLVACAQDHSGYSFTADLSHTNFSDAWFSQAFRMTRQRVMRGEQAGRLCQICPHQQSS